MSAETKHLMKCIHDVEAKYGSIREAPPTAMGPILEITRGMSTNGVTPEEYAALCKYVNEGRHKTGELQNRANLIGVSWYWFKYHLTLFKKGELVIKKGSKHDD